MEKIVIYQIFTRLFGNTLDNNVKNGSIEENGCGKFNDITENALREIKKLGISHIWYTGIIEHAVTTNYSEYGIAVDYPEIVKGKAGSPYAIKDYYDVDPDLAVEVLNRMDEFLALVERTHKEEMKVIIDFVPNHLARNYISDMRPNGMKDFGSDDDITVPFKVNNNFYYIPGEEFDGPVTPKGAVHYVENPAKVTGNDCKTSKPGIYDWYETVKLNYGVNIFKETKTSFKQIPDTWNKMLDILLYWGKKGVDGFRCDMAEMVPVEFWHWVIPKVKEYFPRIVFIAEVYNPNLYRQFISFGGFDFLYDKVGLYDTLKSIMAGQQPTSAISKAWDQLNGIHKHMLFFLENHDEQRIASSFFAGDPWRAIPAMIVSGTLYANPLMLYFGQELGEQGMDEEGYSGLDGRTSIFDYWGVKLFQQWVNNKNYDGGQLPADAVKLRNWYNQFLHILNDFEEIKLGKFYDLMWYNESNHNFDCNHMYAFLRYYNRNILMIVVNFSDNNVHCRVKIPPHAFFTIGVESKKFFKGLDIITNNNKISFPQEIAITNGVGVSVPANSGCIYSLQ